MIIHQLLLYIDKYLLIIDFGLYYEELRKMVTVLLTPAEAHRYFCAAAVYTPALLQYSAVMGRS